MRLLRYLSAFLLATVVVIGLGPVRDPDPASEPGRKIGRLAIADAMDVFAARVADNPSDAVSATVLGQLAIQRARETADPGYYLRAKSAFESAIRFLPDRLPARAGLAKTYLSLHQFHDALRLGTEIEETSPGSGLEVVADAQLALGDYQAAEMNLRRLAEEQPSPLAEIRLAQLEFLKGNIESARARAIQAARQIDSSGATGEPAAWFHTRVGSFELASGRYEAAEAAYRTSIEIFPDYYIGQIGLAQALTAQGDYQGAIEAYEASLSVEPHLENLSALGELYKRLGEPAKAKEVLQDIDLEAELAEGLHDREVALYLIEFGDPQRALHIAREAVEERSDVHTYDTLAWAAYHTGNIDEALEAAKEATTLGTADAALWYHLGVIKHAAGDDAGAFEALEHALWLSPQFDPVEADHARTLLDQIRSEF